MKIYIKKATILDPTSPYHGSKKDLLIEKGKVVDIADELDGNAADHIVESNDLFLSHSWTDLKANFCDPGNEHKEDLRTGSDCAEAGGFGHVFLTADNHPVTDSKAQVKYISSYNQNTTTQLHPIGSITEHLESEQLSEMYDMFQNGVRLFSDATHFISAGIMHRALLYCQNFDGLVVSFPQNESIMGEGQVNEGIASVKTGLKAIPAVGEKIQIQRDLSILEYTGGKLHFSGITTKDSVDLIRDARKKGLKVTCDVHVSHLLYTEKEVLNFDTNHKVLPPYRTEADRAALWNGLRNNTIDCIVSDHQPQNIEEKDVEFDNASFGTITLQSLYGSLSNNFDKDHALLISKLSNNPRNLVGIPTPPIDKGIAADFTLFDPNIEWKYDEQINRSKSKNSPLMNTVIKGAAVAIINGDQLKLNQIN